VSKEFKVGLIVLVAGVVLYFGFRYLKGTDLFNKSMVYYVLYENVDGLNKSNPVIINGLTVGKVSDINLLQAEENQILVELTINEDIILGDSTVAELANSDILGSKAIVLNIGEIKRELEPGDTLIAKVDRGLEAYLDRVQPITNNLNITISRINEILLGLQGSGEKINNTLSELEQTLKGVNSIIASNKTELNETMKSVNALVSNINDRVDQLEPILTKSDILVDSLNQIDLKKSLRGIDQLVAQLDKTLLQLQNTEGTLGRLMNDDSLYNNINQLMIDLDKLAIHFNRYPKDFMKPLGRKHKNLKGLSETDKEEQ